MDDNHKLDITEHQAKLNAKINNSEGLQADGLWKSVSNPSEILRQGETCGDRDCNAKAWDNELQAITARHKVERLEMEWYRYALQELSGVRTDEGIPDDRPVYFEACEKQFRKIYEKLEDCGYRDASHFRQEVKSLYTTFGKCLSKPNRVALRDRFEGLLVDRSEWTAENSGDGNGDGKSDES